MVVTHEKSFRGRKARIGGICFDAGRMGFFVGYHKCPSCELPGKVIVTIDEAREFTSKVGSHKPKMKQRFAKWVAENSKY